MMRNSDTESAFVGTIRMKWLTRIVLSLRRYTWEWGVRKGLGE